MVTTSAISGSFVLPNDAAPGSAIAKFTLVGFDAEGSSIVAPYEVSYALTTAGAMPAGAKLWRNTEGYAGTSYTVALSVVVPDAFGGASKRVEKTIAKRIQVGDSSSYTIGQLLAATPPTVTTSYWSTITEAEYDAAIEAADRAEAAALDFVEIAGAGDGVTSAETAWQTAQADGRPIYLRYGDAYLVTNPENTLCRDLIGPGRVQFSEGGSLHQLNSYVTPQPVVQRQHLWRVKNRIIAGEYLKVAIIGDSTATDGYGVDIDTAVKDEMLNVGLNVSSVVNSAVSGTSWTTGVSNVASILNGYAEQKHLAIIKYGINEAAVDGAGNPNLVPLRNAMIAQLTAIRASTYGGYDDLSILLIMPNTLADTVKNTIWLEAMQGVYAEMAREYRCAIYNPYVESQNAASGENRWLDSAKVHPQPNYNLDIWGRAIRETLQPMASVRRNRVVNVGASGGNAPAASVGLGSYPIGYSHMRAEFSDGYPFSGALITERGVDTTGMQRLYSFAGGSTDVRVRTWETGVGWYAWRVAVV